MRSFINPSVLHNEIDVRNLEKFYAREKSYDVLAQKKNFRNKKPF